MARSALSVAPSATIFRRDHDRELRAALESRRGETYTEMEWSEARSNLLAFFALLAEYKDRGIIRDE